MKTLPLRVIFVKQDESRERLHIINWKYKSISWKDEIYIPKLCATKINQNECAFNSKTQANIYDISIFIIKQY